jgi:hypothetical protein
MIGNEPIDTVDIGVVVLVLIQTGQPDVFLGS